MNAQQKEVILRDLTNEQFRLNQLINQLELKGRDTHYVEVKVEKVKKDINSLIKH